jgi:hypothetical protein
VDAVGVGAVELHEQVLVAVFGNTRVSEAGPDVSCDAFGGIGGPVAFARSVGQVVIFDDLRCVLVSQP